MAITSQEFKESFRKMASSVGIASTLDARQKPVGFTISSLVSVSMEPPLLLFSLGEKNGYYQEFMAAKAFIIQLLAQGQRDLARDFANPACLDRYGKYPLTQGELGIPILKDCLVVFECLHENTFSAGDHQLLLLRIVHARSTPGLPLLYHTGDYTHLQPKA